MPSVVVQNMLTRPGYTPYCGADHCPAGMPRTRFVEGQFECRCGWRSEHTADVIEKYERVNNVL